LQVQLSVYNPEWVNIFNKEKELLKNSLGSKAIRIEHFGSTSVEGLWAKPVIDILLGVHNLDDAQSFIPQMQKLGYEYISKYEDIMPERRYFKKPVQADLPEFHVHSFELATEHWRRHIMFRDYLRSHDKTKHEYFNIKKELAYKEWNDVNEYADAKTKFIRSIENEALIYFTQETEKAECEAVYEIYNTDDETKKKCMLSTKRFGIATAVRTDIFPGFSHNRVTGLGFDRPLNEFNMAEVKNFYSSSPNKFAFQLAPLVIDRNIVEKLNTLGFKLKNNWVRFYRDVAPLENVKTGLELKEIGKEHADEYGNLILKNFSFPDDLKNVFNNNIGNSNWKHYMTFDGDIPVGAGAVFFNGDTAWIGFAATEPDYRNRGSQAAILSARIDEARKRGCKWISVETAEDTSEHDAPSYRNMLRYGFNLMYLRPNFVHEPKNMNE